MKVVSIGPCRRFGLVQLQGFLGCTRDHFPKIKGYLILGSLQ